MRDRFELIHAPASKGMSKSAIARTLGVHRHTVQKYLALEIPPERRHYTHKVSALARYESYVFLERWSGGCRNAMQLWRGRSRHRATPAPTATSRVLRLPCIVDRNVQDTLYHIRLPG